MKLVFGSLKASIVAKVIPTATEQPIAAARNKGDRVAVTRYLA